jgi:hypothetical protein
LYERNLVSWNDLDREVVFAIQALNAEVQRLENKSFAATFRRNPNAKCKCEHWQTCFDCYPTAQALKENT